MGEAKDGERGAREGEGQGENVFPRSSVLLVLPLFRNTMK